MFKLTFETICLMCTESCSFSSSPSLTPLPLLLMLLFPASAPPIPWSYIICAGLMQVATAAAPSTATAMPHPQNSTWCPSILWFLYSSYPSWGCSLGQAGAGVSLRAKHSTVTYPEHPGHLVFSILTIALCKKKFL